ncbi:hypothetical protein GLA29479_122 [Lysobacter antibioticus]|nr:hypothetical protein GLA29479_122 [Lysobacter antibioticus]
MWLGIDAERALRRHRDAGCGMAGQGEVMRKPMVHCSGVIDS